MGSTAHPIFVSFFNKPFHIFYLIQFVAVDGSSTCIRKGSKIRVLKVPFRIFDQLEAEIQNFNI